MSEDIPGEFEQVIARARDFIVDTPGMKVTPESMAIPPEARTRFYQLVEQAQDALLSELGAGEVERAQAAASRLAKVRDGIVAASDLEQLRLPQAVQTYVDDAHASLRKPLFGVVMDVLSGAGSVEAVRSVAGSLLARHAATMYRCAVELEAYLGIVSALHPVRFWEVFSPDTLEMRAMPTGSMTIGAQVTSPERRMPEALFQTADGRLFAMKTELARELDFYGAKIKRRRDMSLGGNTVDQVAHRVLLLYRVASIDAVPLLADRDHLKVLASDLMVEAVMPGDMQPGLACAMFLERLETMHSKRPVQMLLVDGAAAAPAEAEGDPRLELCQWRRLDADGQVARQVAALLDEPQQAGETK